MDLTRTIRSGGAGVQRQPRFDILALAFIALVTLTLLGPLMQFGSGELSGDGNPIRQVGYIALLGVIIFALRPVDVPRRLAAVPLLFLAALAWCWLSLSWSVVPAIAVRRLTLTTIIIWSTFMVVRGLGYERVIPILRVVLVVTLIVNFAVVLVWPDIGIHQFDEHYDMALIGDWRGIMQHKNIAGATTALTILLLVFDSRRIPAAARWGVLTVAVVFLLKSGSRTSLGLCLGGVGAGMLYAFYNARYRVVLIPLVSIATLAGGVIVNIYNTPWKSEATPQQTFTGRTEIWDTLLRYSATNRMGDGYGSFWNVGPASPVYQYGKDWVLTLASGHNGFLDLLVTIGAVGVVLVVAAAMIWPLGRLLVNTTAGPQRGALLFSGLFFTAAHNCTESSVFDRDTIVGVFLLIFVALIVTITEDSRLRRPDRVPFRDGLRGTSA